MDKLMSGFLVLGGLFIMLMALIGAGHNLGAQATRADILSIFGLFLILFGWLFDIDGRIGGGP